MPVTSNLIVCGFSSSLSAGFYRGQLNYLKAAGYDIAIITSPGPEAERLAREEGVQFFPVPMVREISPLRDLHSLVRIFRLLRRLRPAATNFSTPKAGLLGTVAAGLARVPCRIYTLRGLRLETTSGIKRLILWLTEWLACRMSHVTVCISPSLRDRAVQLGLVERTKARVFGHGSSNGIDAARFGRTSDLAVTELRSRLGIPAAASVVGFVGRLVRDKGIPELVEAFRQLSATHPQLRLLLAGDFEQGDPVPDEIRRYIESEPRIVHVGFVGDIAPYYKLMDVFAFPTHREGFGGASLEAQASGVPVVATRATGAVDSIVDGETGLLVPVGDANSLAAAIGRLLDDPELRLRMGRSGRLRAEREFDPEIIWQGLADLYRDLVKARSPRSGVRHVHDLPCDDASYVTRNTNF